MATDTEQSFDNFSIEDTMELGAGNSQLLRDLMSPETATEDSDKLQNISEEVKGDDVSKKQTAQKGKEITPEAEKDKPERSIQEFLGSEEEEEEEVVEKSKKVKSSLEKEEDDDVKVDPTQYSALANDLFDLGVFTKEEGEDNVLINTPQEFLERFNDEKKKGAIEVVNNFIGQFGEDYQNAFDAIFVKGVNPTEYFNTFNTISNYKDLDLSIETNQMSVMKKTLADQGFEAEDIDTEIERLKNYGDLESVATKHHKVLVKKEVAELQRLEQESQQELQYKAKIKNQYVSNVQTILGDKVKAKNFDGIPINPKLATELQDFLLVDKYKTTSGETITDFDRTILELKKPENHEMKVKVGLILKILEKDPTLSTIQKTGVTKQSDIIFGSLAKQVTADKSSKPSTSQQPNSWFR